MSSIAQQQQKIPVFKIITIGMSGVGKTSFITRYSDNTFTSSFKSTIGVDFRMKTVNIDSYDYKIQLWDTAGQERFRSISTAYYRHADGLIFAMDPSQPDSLQTIARLMEDAIQNCNKDIAKILIITKNDLGINAWQTDSDAIEQFAEKNCMPMFRTSAKTGENVELAMESLVKTISFQYAAGKGKEQGIQQQGLQKEENQQQNKSTCC